MESRQPHDDDMLVFGEHFSPFNPRPPEHRQLAVTMQHAPGAELAQHVCRLMRLAAI
jgi:hypothetical protein